ncbi:unnamed protein product [Cyclocybe aegerita]|uniref:Fe2OG dioxygenase domain-containing protein n=1 Tax=Cyclocybe aegerita TaxID=1973307 RepID=A0A8S0XMB9_CYCAE|nr:unnamed protein product [Cyclocybe aegerita]
MASQESSTDVEALYVALQEKFQETKRKPLYIGTVPLEPNVSKLFFSKEGLTGAGVVDFSQPTEGQLEALAAACQPATFGLGQQDILDESYRKAGKMDAANFAAQFTAFTSGITDRVGEFLLEAPSTPQSLRFELYKLNIYGPGSFFKAHVDTPRSDKMIASLVIVFPTVHVGGSLLLRHEGQEWTFDSPKLVYEDGKPRVAFAAFYSDIEHEVTPVNSGYRVTLTYNIYSEPAVSPSSNISFGLDRDAPLRETLSALLQHPDFLPDGGYIGFGLSHKYPVNPNLQLSKLSGNLKGTDADIYRVCRSLSLDTALQVLYCRSKQQKQVYTLIDRFVEYRAGYGNIDTDNSSITVSLSRMSKGRLVVHQDGAESTEEEEWRQEEYSRYNPQLMVWVGRSLLDRRNALKTAYVAHGNEASLAYVYGQLCLVVHVAPFAERVPKAQAETSEMEPSGGS